MDSKRIAIFLILAALATFTLTAINMMGDGPIELDGVEIREYEGKDLSSVQDFRENSIKGPQYIDIASYSLKVTGLVDNPTSFTYDEVIGQNQHYKKVVTLRCVEGWQVTILWEGVMLKELLADVGIKPEATVIIFHAYDGYTTSFPVSFIMENDILMAFKMNDVTLPPERGYPFQLVAESKWGYKWIKWITEIEFSSDTDYEGYWESRGYSNSGSLEEGFFD